MSVELDDPTFDTAPNPLVDLTLSTEMPEEKHPRWGWASPRLADYLDRKHEVAR